MTSLELVKSIYETAQFKNKIAWLSEKQESFLFQLLYKEGKIFRPGENPYIATILPDGTWRNDLKIEEAIKIGIENNVNSSRFKRVYVVRPPFYIRREKFNLKKNNYFIRFFFLLSNKLLTFTVLNKITNKN